MSFASCSALFAWDHMKRARSSTDLACSRQYCASSRVQGGMSFRMGVRIGSVAEHFTPAGRFCPLTLGAGTRKRRTIHRAAVIVTANMMGASINSAIRAPTWGWRQEGSRLRTRLQSRVSRLSPSCLLVCHISERYSTGSGGGPRQDLRHLPLSDCAKSPHNLIG